METVLEKIIAPFSDPTSTLVMTPHKLPLQLVPLAFFYPTTCARVLNSDLAGRFTHVNIIVFLSKKKKGNK